jgi:hypothetical protein
MMQYGANPLIIFTRSFCKLDRFWVTEKKFSGCETSYLKKKCGEIYTKKVVYNWLQEVNS